MGDSKKENIAQMFSGWMGPSMDETRRRDSVASYGIVPPKGFCESDPLCFASLLLCPKYTTSGQL